MKMIYFTRVAAAIASVSTSFAFVHSNGCRAFHPTQRSSSSTLSYYKPDEPFSKRLSHVQSELESIHDGGGLQQFITDELTSAEKKLMNNVDYANQYANKVSESDRDEIHLAKQILKGALKQGREIASEVKEIKREFDELQAAKILESATQDIVYKDVSVEKGLVKAMESVAIALKDADEVLQTVVLSATSQDRFTDELKDKFMKKLELSAQKVNDAIKNADSAAKTAKEMVIDDDATLAQLEKTTARLTDAIEATERVTSSLEGNEGGAEVDALADSLKIAADDMVNDLTAVRSIASAITRKIELQTNAMLGLDQKAGEEAVGAINAAKAALEQSNSDTNIDTFRASLQASADKVQLHEHEVKEFAEAIISDAGTDATAAQVISDADKIFNELIDGVKETVDEVVSDFDSGEVMDDADAISDELVAVQGEEEQAEKAIKSLEEAEEKVSESAVGELKESTIQTESPAEVESKSVVLNSDDGQLKQAEQVKEPPTEQAASSAEASEHGGIVESHSSTSDLQLQADKTEDAMLTEKTSPPANIEIKANAEEGSDDSREGLTASTDSRVDGGETDGETKAPEELLTDSMDKSGAVSEEVTGSQSALDTASVIENSGVNEEQATDHIDSLKSAIASASDELSSKLKLDGDGDSITASIDSVQDAATSAVTQSLAEAVVVATSFLHHF
ncbi:hypothetical protein ACHAWC_004245 [Mediolabrus comicus]